MAHSSGKRFSADEFLSRNKVPDGCPINGNREHIGGDGLHWHLYIGLVLFLATMTAGQTTINTEISGKDCLVDYVKRNEASPKYHFTDGVLLLGFLPVRPTDQVLSGINITIYKNIHEEILTVTLPDYYHLITKCYKSKNFTEQSFIGSFGSKADFDWQHFMLSVKNRSFIINGKYLMCSMTLVNDKSVYIVVTPTRDPIYLVPNCQDACPVFRNSLSIMNGLSSVSVANMSVEAGTNMTHIVTTNNGSDLLLSSVTSTWQQLYIKVSGRCSLLYAARHNIELIFTFVLLNHLSIIKLFI
nr:uncharacterized protein LOC128703681 [Cherax quadricarinatus]